MNVSKIRQNVDSILQYLDKYSAFINCHMVSYFTDDHWNNYISEELRSYVKKNDIKIIIENTFWNSVKDSTNPVGKFYDCSKKFWLENLKDMTINVEDFYKSMDIISSDTYLSVKGFMAEKKLHEVELTSEFVANLVGSFKNDDNFYIVDAGDGKGYLSSRLALEHQLKVLGVDANEINSESAAERNRKLQKAWNGLVEREKLISVGEIPPRHGKKKKINNQNRKILKNYKVVTKFITPELDFQKLIMEQFDLENYRNINICLTGLHTCGNLASTSLEVFKEQSHIKYLCNIGCCYHLINEEFCKDEFFVNKKIAEKNIISGFPLSEHLRKKQFKLGRNARMLASQSIHRTLAKKDLPEKSLFYRALLEEIIVNEKPQLKNLVQVGKIKNYVNFQEYVEKCDTKLNLQLSNLNQNYLMKIEENFSQEEIKLNLFYLLRMCLAPVIESLILLDRLLFLYESDFDNTFLIKLFNPIVSPRCYAIVAIKE